MDWVEGYLAALEILVIMAVPLVLVVAGFVWVLAWLVWPYRLVTVLALIMSIIGACGTILAWVTLYRYRVGPVPPEMLALNGTAVVVLVYVTPLIITAYLIWLVLRGGLPRRGGGPHDHSDDQEHDVTLHMFDRDFKIRHR